MNIGDLVTLKSPVKTNDFWIIDVRVYFVNNPTSDYDYDLSAGLLPINSVGIIVKKLNEGISFLVLIENKFIFVSDSYIEPFDINKQQGSLKRNNQMNTAYLRVLNELSQYDEVKKIEFQIIQNDK